MTLPFPLWPPHPGAASVLDLGSCYGFINDNWVAGNSDQCHDSFLCDWLSSSKRLFWEPRLRQSLPPYLVVTSHHQGRKSHQTSKSALGWQGALPAGHLCRRISKAGAALTPGEHGPFSTSSCCTLTTGQKDLPGSPYLASSHQ